jgi:tetratricopeptide (TPR) repeat protein
MLPGGAAACRADLEKAALQLRARAEVGGQGPPAATALVHRTHAVILSALGDPGALAEANHVVALAPESHEAYLVRARIRHRLGDLKGALADVEAGLAREPGDPGLLALLGLLETESGHPGAALIVLNRAIIRGAPAAVHAPKALAMMALGGDEAALEEWSLALDDDPENPRLYLGRARALLRLRRWARALVDLEQAAEWADGHPGLLIRIAITSAACLPACPDRFSQWLGQARRALAALVSESR